MFPIGRKSNRLPVAVPSCRFKFGIAAMPALLCFFVCVVIACDGVLEAADQRGENDTSELTFETDEGFIFDAKAVSPRESKRRGAAVLMMGGGIGNDLNWTTPGTIDVSGQKQQLTISGQSHADGPKIAEVLADRGFCVMHWSTIRRDDPKRDQWPQNATSYSMSDQVRHAKDALAVLRAQPGVRRDRVFLLAHSLGAVRAVNIAAADAQVAGLILLSPAQLTRTAANDRGRNLNRQRAEQILNSLDPNPAGQCERDEWNESLPELNDLQPPPGKQQFEQLDFDHNGVLGIWELSAGLARRHRQQIDWNSAQRSDGYEMLWTEDVLKQSQIPTLIVYGAMDNAQAHHAPVFADIVRDNKLDHISIEIAPHVGHQLGPEVNDRVGPISNDVLKMIAVWLEQTMRSL